MVLTGDDQVRELNHQWRGEDAATDVLSFPQQEPGEAAFGDPEVLGDVVISLDTAACQAAARGHGIDVEVALLAAHGTLHLLGLEHGSPAGWRPFHRAEELTRRALSDARAGES